MSDFSPVAAHNGKYASHRLFVAFADAKGARLDRAGRARLAAGCIYRGDPQLSSGSGPRDDGTRQAVVECAQLSRGRPATSAALRRGRSPGAGMVGGEAGAVGEPDQRGVAGSPAADRAPEPHRGHRHRPGSAMKTVESSAAPGVATGNGEQTSVGGERYDTAPVSFIRPSGTGNERRSRRAPSGRRRPQLRLPPQRVAGTPLS